MAAKVSIKGMDAIRRKLSNVQDFQKWATPPMVESTEALKQRVRTYPPPKTSYIRTGTLRRSIARRTLKRASGLIGRVFSKGANQGRGNYEQWVKVFGRQTDVHRRNEWPTDVDDLEAETPAINKRFKDAPDSVLES